MHFEVQWNPSIPDTIGTHKQCPDQEGVQIREASRLERCPDLRGSTQRIACSVHIIVGVLVLSEGFHCTCIINSC